ncbi:MAG: cupin domain-containing protein [Anaerolineales bacterium]|nr:cupin domain-containing protein [Anaerolineales bacterium]
MSVNVYKFERLGYKPLLLTPNWQVAIMNWDPSCERKNLHEIERHNQTEEGFVLLRGKAALFTHPDDEALQVYDLEPGVVYSVPKRVWHRLVANQQASLLIVEDLNTHLHDTEVRLITEEELSQLDARLPEWVKS